LSLGLGRGDDFKLRPQMTRVASVSIWAASRRIATLDVVAILRAD
jgi:hypothetical protein